MKGLDFSGVFMNTNRSFGRNNLQHKDRYMTNYALSSSCPPREGSANYVTSLYVNGAVGSEARSIMKFWCWLSNKSIISLMK
jgi:hypothetical protein